MLTKSYIFLLIGHLLLFSNAEIIFKFVNQECSFNSKFVVNVICKLKAINWRRTEASIEGDIVGVLRNVSVNLKGYSKNYANKFQPFAIDMTINACDLLAKRVYPTLGVLILKIIKNFTNINHSCPYMGHAYVKNLYFDAKMVPSFIPLGSYKNTYRFFEGYPFEDVGIINVYTDVMDIISRQPRKKHPKNGSESFH